MRARLAFHIAPVKLVQSLKRDGATLLGTKLFGNLLPRLALLALCADEINERLKAAAICSPTAALPTSPIFGFRIHCSQFTPMYVNAVSE
jgi:hypothetical protein